MPEEPIFPWCPDCPIYSACYVDDNIFYIEEDCRFGIANDWYAQEMLKGTEKSYIQIFIT